MNDQPPQLPQGLLDLIKLLQAQGIDLNALDTTPRSGAGYLDGLDKTERPRGLLDQIDKRKRKK